MQEPINEPSPPASPEVPHNRRRWWRSILVACKDAPVTVAIIAGTELKFLGPHEVKAGPVIEYTQATDLEEGPRGSSRAKT